MGIWNLLTGLVKPVTDLVDNLHTSDQERMQLQAKLLELQTTLAAQMLDYESKLVKAKTDVIQAEASGQSWLQRNWRPITMLTFLALVVADTLGWTAFRLSEQAWTLLQIGLGGYVVGRSAEKVYQQINKK